MIIGVPKEIKNNENRVGMTPSGVAEVVKQGHRVFIQHTAGINSGFPDEAYQAVGAYPANNRRYLRHCRDDRKGRKADNH